ncbi:FAD-binding protein [Amycolatopsis sp. 195334CR]|uniref:FAD-binding oxidoreductase n=1 Tax=Amycolatopsis sp. 195334CR TaxID=2814588 RepID=UPI0027DABCB9|nr:FAD-binding protein [Amycolatopsis sp. 195334CR]
MLVLPCRSTQDVVDAIGHAWGTGAHLVPRGGGHCFAGRSATDGIVLDLSGLNRITVADDGTATIGAGASLGRVYPALHARGRTIPAGCGATVGIAGLTLGGGIGLLGRRYGLTCDRLVRARVVLADGRVVDCDADREPDLFWALRGAGGGQFGVVTSLRFATVPEAVTTRIEAHWPGGEAELVAAWQEWAPKAPDEITANLLIDPTGATLLGAATLDRETTRDLLRGFTDRPVDLAEGVPFHQLKRTLADSDPVGPLRIRSEFFSRTMSFPTIESLVDGLTPAPTPRQLSFTAMGGAYNRVAGHTTAFAHRNEHFLLEHIAGEGDGWVDESWTTAHTEGSGRVYPNFPDLALENPATAYHADNLPRLAAIKKTYDPHQFFDFPQAIQGAQ